MTEAYLYEYMTTKIPLTKAMSVRILSLGDVHEFLFPLSTNHNDKGTGFAGSLAAALTIAAWSQTFRLMESQSYSSDIMLKESRVQYLIPIETDFHAFAFKPDQESIDRLLNHLDRKGKGRIWVQSHVKSTGPICCKFLGEFVVIKK